MSLGLLPQIFQLWPLGAEQARSSAEDTVRSCVIHPLISVVYSLQINYQGVIKRESLCHCDGYTH